MVRTSVRYIFLSVIIIKKKHCPYKPGSVPCRHGVCHLSSPRVTPWLKRSTLHRITRAGNPQTMVYMNLQPPVGTAQRSPVGWWSLTPPSHPYPLRGGCFLLPAPTVTNSFYFRKWSALCCPDFPLARPFRSASDKPLQCVFCVQS